MSHGMKRPRQKSKPYLEWLHELPCVVTGRSPVEACHVRYGDFHYGKPHSGAAEKPDDIFCLPLTSEMHRDQHKYNEQAWWKARCIDPLAVCALLFVHYTRGDIEAARLVCLHAREIGR
jgi:hypothetical protein